LDAAVRLVSLGYTVIGTVRKEKDAAAVSAAAAKGWTDENGETHSSQTGVFKPVICDVTTPDGVKRLQAAVELQRQSLPSKRLIGLVNNAGVGAKHTFEDWVSGKVSEDAKWIFDVNVMSVFNVTGTLLPALAEDAKACGSTRIVNIGSLAGFATRDIDGVYSGSKGAIESITDGMRRLFTPKGIFTAVVEPGYIASNLCTRAQCKDRAVDTTTPAIVHALVNPRPRPRYPVASAGNFPGWLVRFIFTHLPDALLDQLVRLDNK